MKPYPVFLHPQNLESSDRGRSSSYSSDNDQYHATTSHMIRWKSGKNVDSRLLALLELFGEIYVDRREFFNRIFDDDHEELFKKIGHVIKKKKQIKKSRSMKRSKSMTTIRQRGFEEDGPIRLERFKVKTPNVIVAADDQGQGDQVTKGSK